MIPRDSKYRPRLERSDTAIVIVVVVFVVVELHYGRSRVAALALLFHHVLPGSLV